MQVQTTVAPVTSTFDPEKMLASLDSDRLASVVEAAHGVERQQRFSERFDHHRGNLSAVAMDESVKAPYAQVATSAVQYGLIPADDLRAIGVTPQPRNGRLSGPEALALGGKGSEPTQIVAETLTTLKLAEDVLRAERPTPALPAMRAARMTVTKMMENSDPSTAIAPIAGKLAPIVEEAGLTLQHAGRIRHAAASFGQAATLVEIGQSFDRERVMDRAAARRGQER